MKKPNSTGIYDYYPSMKGTDCGRVIEELRRKYALGADARGTNGLVMATNLLMRFAQAVDALKIEDLSIDRVRIEGLKVLDIACGHDGARTNEVTEKLPNMARELCKPWLPRIAAILGADTTGVDLYYPRYKVETKKGRTKEIGCIEEDWKFVQRDLLEPSALDETTFPAGSYDVVHCRSFITDDFADIIHNDPAILRLLLDDPRRHLQLWKRVNGDAHRLLKEGGLCLLNKEKLIKQPTNFRCVGDLDEMTNIALDRVRQPTAKPRNT